MSKIIAACGNDCSMCPRFLPKSEEELHQAAVLWEKIGYRDHVVTNEEIQCSGCKKGNFCRFGIVDCVEEKHLPNCGHCSEYPCEKIEETFEKTMVFEPACEACCTSEEYAVIAEAFFNKKKNLDFIKKKIK